MMFAKLRFTATLIALEKLLRVSAWRYPEFRARLKEKSFTAGIKLRDNSQGRCFRFENGKVRSRAGIWPADVSMAFQDAELAARLLKPNKKQLDYLHAAKNFQLEVQGPDELTIWFSETLNMLLTLGRQLRHRYGRRRAPLHQQHQRRAGLRLS